MQKIRHVILPYSAYIILGLAFLVAMLFGYWINQSEDILEIKNHPVKATVVKEYPPNGVVVLDVDFCKNSDAKGEVKRSFVGSSTEIYMPTEEDRQEKMCRKADIPHAIPPQAAPGKYKIHYEVTYKINPIKTVVVEFDSKEFELKAPQNRGTQGIQGEQGIQGIQGEPGK